MVIDYMSVIKEASRMQVVVQLKVKKTILNIYNTLLVF